jgi:hypothetical protein
VLHGQTREHGDLLGGLSRPDPRLDVPWSHPALGLDLQLPQPGAIEANGRPQRVVDDEEVLLPVRRRQHQVLPVVMHANELEVLHASPLQPRLGSTVPLTPEDPKHRIGVAPLRASPA